MPTWGDRRVRGFFQRVASDTSVMGLEILKQIADSLEKPAGEQARLPKTCLFWSCSREVQPSRPFCHDHYRQFEQGIIDECPGCGKAKDIQYELCLKCENQPKPQRRSYIWYKPEYSAAWQKADATAEKFYVYLLRLNGGRFYAGQTRELRERLSEHKDGGTRSTVGRAPKLVWFATVPTRQIATAMEANLKELIDTNPRQIRRMIISFRDLTRELDYSFLA